MVTIYNSYSHEIARFCIDMDEAMKWIASQANQLNYGVYRSWTTNGKTFYDVGPRVYYIEENKR